ncbi:MAG: hypothetical protein WCE90_12725 [Candidatus Zixiibacteriota bacterium]
MENQSYNISNGISTNAALSKPIKKLLGEFAQKCRPIEETIYVFVDAKTGAYYCECHMSARNLLKLSTTDVPLDPDEQAEYRANRDVVEDDVAFEQMKSDAVENRTFSNIVAEFDTLHNPKYPVKIIGGQHRYMAIKEAQGKGIDTHHGLKIYFALNKEQRLDVQLISNTNIAASTDLYDRLQETASGPELRKWCQDVGFLDPGKDFSAKRQRSSAISVRAVRSFISNFYLGKQVDSSNFENIDTTPIFCRTGKPDPDWEKLRKENPNIWSDEGLKQAAKEFVRLDQSQHAAIQDIYQESNKTSLIYADKALTFSVMTAWAYVAGILQANHARLQRHFDLGNWAKGRDPLNAEAMAEGRHKSDAEKYRGLGTRNDEKERGRCVELFYLQAESGKGITPAVIDAAIKRHYTKQAKLEQLKAEKKV